MEWMLRPWKEEDAGDLARFADNPHIAANLRNAFPSPYSREDAVAYICACLEGDEDRQLTWAIQADGRAVGSIGVFRGEDVYEKNGEVGYWLAEPYWGRGIMTAAVRLAVGEAFARLDLCRLYAEPFARNTASRRVLEKAGFTLEGILRDSVFKQGEVLDSCLYALLRRDWDKIRTNV